MALQRAKEETSPHDPNARPLYSAPKQALLLSNVAVSVHCGGKEEQKREKEEEEEDDEDEDEEDHFRHRRLTGDSGIEVCRCHVKRGQQEDEEPKKGGFDKGGKDVVKEGEKADVLQDAVDCSQQKKVAAQSSSTGDCAEQRGHVSSPSSIIINRSEAIITVESL